MARRRAEGLSDRDRQLLTKYRKERKQQKENQSMSNLRMDDLNDDEREEVLTRGAEATRAAIEDVRSRRGDAKLREGYNAALNRLSESYNGRIPPSALANLKREWRAKGLEVW